jgi:hypothetical protein
MCTGQCDLGTASRPVPVEAYPADPGSVLAKRLEEHDDGRKLAFTPDEAEHRGDLRQRPRNGLIFQCR